MLKDYLKKIYLIFYFNKVILLITCSISLLIWSFLGFKTGKVIINFIGLIFWFKLITNFLIFYLNYLLNMKSLILYYNLKINEIEFYLIPLFSDVLIFILLLLII